GDKSLIGLNYTRVTGDINIREPSGHRLPLENQDCSYRASVTIISRHQDIAKGPSAIRPSRGEAAARRLGAARDYPIPRQTVLQKLEIGVGGSLGDVSIGGGGDPAMTISRPRDMNIDVVHIGLVI